MLSMKSLYSPLAFVFRSSHEQLNPWHRLTGRIIYFLLILHATWYLNYFIQAGVLYQRLTATIVIIGIIAFSLLSIIVTTALETVRRWSYRAFFILHLFIGVALMPLLFLHAKPLHIYTSEALALFVVDIICRKLDTVTGFSTITPIPNTKLLQLKIPVPPSKIARFRAAPGQHVYLSIPAESTPAKNPASIHDLLFNPFTIADVSGNSVTLVLRALHGPTTKAISTLANLRKAKPPINIEGPYGSSRRFPNLASKYDRILLVAGGVGATFIVPIYKDLREQMDAEPRSPDRMTFTWSMRSGAEASWVSEVEIEEADSLRNDENVKVYITGGSLRDRSFAPEDGSVELEELQGKDEEEPIKANGGWERPDLGKIVDELFRLGNEERVAVLVCGPADMARQLRGHVGKWVGKGREVWFHDESFGW
jgi:NAD(P)H-flavin reductase